MYLMYELLQWRDEQQRSPSLLHIMSCHHNTRENIEKELNTVQNYYHQCSRHRVQYNGDIYDENSLRKRRHQSFINLAHTIASKYLLLWHHGDDRIETTVLNMMRGCNINGIIAMKQVDSHFLDPSIQIIRPLLSHTKQEILEYCHKLEIPYHIDPTNNISTTSQRNTVRKELDWLLKKGNFFQSIQTLYRYLEDNTPTWPQISHSDTLSESSFFLYPQWNNTYLCSTIYTQWTPDKLYQLYHHFNITINPRTTTLAKLADNLNKKSSNKVTYQWVQIQAFSYCSVIQIQ